MKARAKPDREEVFEASAYAVSRPMLRKFLGLDVARVNQRAFSDMESVSTYRPLSSAFTVTYDHFSILEMKPIPFVRQPVKSRFSITRPVEMLPGYARIQGKITEAMAKYDQLSETLRNEMKLYATHPVEARIRRQGNLIDRFLEDLPSMKRPNPLEMPEQTEAHEDAITSLEEDEEMVSETLAKLLVMQRKHEEAIEMYQKLSLHFPEKSGYFNLEISKIKKL
ncbi:hypothetical protein [Pontibacter sp. G13]|uniref:hypothetical protein n=1 Tax=Pontibacter sp. G13 TaxID=3074898 RepID=UPI002889D2EF|nr:hypothetical protein [Pontibacter sp. G13]WNJ18089.1 hypothetical protein RJD25_24805 [Pontibacter sp. G13]